MVKNFFIVISLVVSTFAFSIKGVSQSQNDTYLFDVENMDKVENIGLITNDKIISCDPDISGAFEYLNSNKIILYPNKPLAKGSKYICGNANGRISFNTEPFKIDNIRALDDKNFILSLNDKTNLNELRLKLKVYTKESSSKNTVPFKVDTSDNLNFLITLEDTYDNLFIYLPKNLRSKANITLENFFEQDISKNSTFFKDNPNAVNFKDVKVAPFAFDDGVLGFKLKTKQYITADKRFIKISGINEFSLSPINYFYDEKDPEYYYEFSIKSLEFKPNTEYKIDILPGFGDQYLLNRELKNFSLKTTDIKPFAKFVDDKPYISKTTDIAFKSANLNSIKVVVDKVSDQNLRYFFNYEEDIEKLTKSIISKNFELDNAFNQILEQRINLDFSEFEDGIYNISLYYKNDKDEMRKITKQAYMSDISALSIVGDNGIFVFTSRISTSKPLPNTNIIIYNENNEILARGKSNENGVYRFEKNKILDTKPRSIFIKNGNEENFLILKNPINDDTLITEDTSKYKALTYFATDIIRPNEDIEGIVVLKDYNFKPVKNLPVKIKIIDPQGKTIKTISKNTDNFGVIDIDETMGDLTGRYSLNVEFANKLVDSKKFSVESFIPQRIKNEIVTSKDEFIGYENIDVNLVSNYLFGAPASNLSGSLTANFSAKELKLEEYKEYSFVNSILDSKSILDSQYFNIQLNKDGKKDFIVKYGKNIPVSNVINLNLNFSILDSSKTISEYKNLTIYPYKAITGIKGNSDFIDSGSSVNFDLLSLESLSKKKINPNLNISIYKISWNYVLSENGYEEQKEINLIDSFNVKKDNFTYKFDNGGNYVVVANDYLNGSSASFELYVSGWGGYGTRSTKDIKKAKIAFNKDMFSPEDEVKVNLSSSIKEGTAIISLVDKKVLDYHIVEIKDNKALTSFKLPKDFTKGHINATIIRDTKPLVTPLRTYANKAIKVDKSAHKSNLKIQVNKEAKNNETVKIKISSEPNSKVVIFIADEGVLQIVNQKELDAFKYFDILTPINVYNYDIYDLLSTYTSNAKALSFGGDAMLEMARKRDLDPVKAKDLKTFKIVKHLMTDDKGEANFEFKSPLSFNSKVRVTAISLNEDMINSKNKYVEIKDDIVIKPSVISYLIKNDELNLPITFINTTNDEKTLNFDINFSKNLDVKFKEQSISLKPLESIQIQGEISALELGNANFTIRLEDEYSRYTHTTNLDILSPYLNSTYSKNGYIKDYQDFNVSDESYKTVYISTSSLPSNVLLNLSKDIIEYPYGCTEQISTKILAMANINTDNEAQKREIEDNIKSGVITLISRLKDNGSFGYWSKFSDTNILASIYTSDVLLEIDKDINLIGKSQKELIFSYLKMPHQDPFHAIYSAYILNEYKALSLSQINYLFDNKIYEHNLVTLYMMAAILKENNLDVELSNVLNEIKNYDLKNMSSDDYNLNFDSNVRNIAFAIYIHSKHFEPNEFSKQMIEILSSNLNNLNSTQKKAFTLRAFKNYFNESKKPIKYTIHLNTKSKEHNSFADVVLDLNGSKSFEISTTEPLYYSVLSFGNEKLPIKHTLPITNDDYYKQDEQINIYRDFVDIDGNKLDLNDLKLNQTIFSRVNVLSNRNYVPNILVDEQISPCFEVVNERIYGSQRSNATKNSISFEYQDIKDERVVSFLVPIKNEQVFYTPLKVVMSGKCTLPVIKVESMQNEDLKDYDLEMESFEVKK